MRKFLIVLQYEMKEYFGNKTFMIITLLLAFGGAFLLFLPRVMDMSSITGVNKSGEVEIEIEDVVEQEKNREILLLDESGYADQSILNVMFPDVNWVIAESAAQIEEAVTSQSAEAGFVIKSSQEFDYYIFNKSMSDSNVYIFQEAMKEFYRRDYFAEKGLDYQEITAVYEVAIAVNEEILNKDSESGYLYCYLLVIVVFMLIVFYGQMIAVSITSEKSNRAIEVLVTSTTPNSLLFGKVIAGAIGGLFQAGLIFGGILIAYGFNRKQWGGMLDMVFQIPADVLIVFALFGLGGYLFYAFLYGAVGALVSKTEDISKSASGLMTVIMIVYLFSLMQLFNIDGTVIKVLSFLPISSYSTMFARLAMGTVAPWEIIVSFLILVLSIAGAGILGARLYRMGTLRYGNPIKLRTALKEIKHSD